MVQLISVQATGELQTEWDSLVKAMSADPLTKETLDYINNPLYKAWKREPLDERIWNPWTEITAKDLEVWYR